MMAPMLSQPFVEESFDFYARTLFGSPEIQPRWRRCSANADNDLGDAVGQAYVKRYFPPESKARMLELVKALEVSLHQDIDAATWMSAETKQKAHEKLKTQIDKIGYPDKWIDYSTLTIKRDDFYSNVTQANLFEFNRRLSKIGKPADRHEWGMNWEKYSYTHRKEMARSITEVKQEETRIRRLAKVMDVLKSGKKWPG